MENVKIKQYIVLRYQITPEVACVACAHGALASYLKNKDDPIVQDWVSGKYGPFYKVICQASSEQEWEAIKKWPNGLHITESRLDGLCVAVVFKPFIWSKSSIFNDLKLYGGKQ